MPSQSLWSQTEADDDIRQRVEDALDWADPCVDGSRIGVTVDEGVVTLRGTVDTPVERLTAERVALRVRGVETVLNHLAVSSQADDEATRQDTAPASARATMASLVLVISLVLATASAARADIGAGVLEPVSALGFYTPVGHAGTCLSTSARTDQDALCLSRGTWRRRDSVLDRSLRTRTTIGRSCRSRIPARLQIV